MLRKRLAFVVVTLALIVALLPSGQAGHAQDSLQVQADAYFGGGPRFLEATALFENLNDGDAENDPYIISLRSAEDYTKGHIPGAVHMDVKELFSLENLATIPPDQEVVVVCYTGQAAAQATAALNMLGYDAYSLLYGMSSWTGDPEVFVKRFDAEKNANDFIIDTEAHAPGGPYELPSSLAVDVVGAADAYFGGGPRFLEAAALFENLNDGDAENDPYIISLRSAEDYGKGHIPGAVNMDVKGLFTLENLATIPSEQEVVVVCYTGQAAAQATAALNMLGYDAYSLLHGMSSWTSDPEVFVKRFDPEKHANDYRIDTEAYAPGGPYELPFTIALPPAAVVEAVDITGVADAYFGGGPRFLEATALFENLNDGDAENDPYIISLRSAEDYTKGHIPGAVHMDVKELFSLENLATIPPDQEVVVVCYTGQAAAQATAALNMLGYDAYSLLYGMSSWTGDPEVFVKRFDAEKNANDFIIDTEAHAPGGPYELPSSLAVDVVGAADAYFGGGPRFLEAAALFENLNDGDAENDPYIISLRSAEDYAKGHIPGAVHMDVKGLFSLENLATIPSGQEVVVVCYTGQAAAQATAALNMLGYDAYSLLHGMSSWTSDPEVYVKRFDPEKHANDYIIDTVAHAPGGPYSLPFEVSGAEEPGTEPTSPPAVEGPAVVAPADNCVRCHIDEVSLRELAVEEEEVESEESAGEG
jgi:rhodanese-related sulfurtransferase